VTAIRLASPEDAEHVRAMWEAVAAEGEWIGTEAPLSPRWVDGFLDALAAPNSVWYVASDERIVGAIFLRDDAGLAHLGMAIVDGYRGQGIGRRLMNTGVSWARDRGCYKVALEVWPHNERAHGLYTSAGFVDEGYLRRHYRRRSGALWDAVAMGLVLDNDAPGRP
jgi:RimJ/RimL family protein N-acetyltransferase